MKSEMPPSAERRRSRRSWLVGMSKTALTLVVVGALGALLYRERELVANALSMEPRPLLLILVFTLAAWIANAFAQGAILRALGRPLPFLEVFALHVGGGLLNHLPMRPGTLYRAHFLKERTGLLYSHFASFTAVNALVPIGTAALMSALALVLNHDARDRDTLLLLGLLLMLALSCAVVLFVPLPQLPGSSRIARIWNELLVGRSTIARYPRAFAVVVACHAASVVFVALRYLGAYAVLDVDIAFSALIVLGSAAKVTTLLSVTPGGIGIQEFTAAATGKLFGVEFALSVVAGSVLRAVLLLGYAAFGSVGLLLLRSIRRRAREG